MDNQAEGCPLAAAEGSLSIFDVTISWSPNNGMASAGGESGWWTPWAACHALAWGSLGRLMVRDSQWRLGILQGKGLACISFHSSTTELHRFKEVGGEENDGGEKKGGGDCRKC